MPPARRTNPKKGKKAAVAEEEEDDGGFQLSQQSNSSDDHDAGLMAAVARQMQLSLDKKKREKEGKFLQVAKKELDKCTSRAIEDFDHNITQMTALYDKFTLDHASVEDEIRTLWVQIREEQNKLLVLSHRSLPSTTTREKDREAGHVQGMALARTACEDMNRLIGSLIED